MVEATSRPLRAGEQAPAFALKDSDMKSVSLESFRGKTVVLAFFPAAFSSGCTAELCMFNDNMRHLDEINASVIGISVDLPYTLREFRRTQHLGFPLLSDFDRTTIRDYGIVDGDFNGYRSGVAQRSLFVIDREGKTAWSWISQKQGESPEYADVVDAVETLS